MRRTTTLCKIANARASNRLSEEEVAIELVADAEEAHRPSLNPRDSRFARRKPARDWRWLLAGVGRVLVSTGVLMFGFVAYQLWGTALQTAAEQRELEQAFEDMLAAGSTLPVPRKVEPSATLITIPPSANTAPTIATVPGGAPTPVQTATVPSTSGGEPPVASPSSTAGDVVTATVPPPVGPPPDLLDIVGRLEVPSIGIDYIVVQGVSATALKKGPGHFPESPLPGQLGNAAIAGHRTTYGQPFANIDAIAPGDDIVVTVPNAGTYIYVSTRTSIVNPEDYSTVVPTRDWTKATLVLISCHPRFSTNQRIVVFAELDQSRSSMVTQPSPPATSDSDRELPGEAMSAPATRGDVDDLR